MDFSEPSTGPSLSPMRTRWWRRLPMGAQLGIISILVAAGWFTAQRSASQIIVTQTQARADQLDRLHLAEVAGVRMLASINAMSSAQRGFVLTGDEAQGQRYEAARRAIDSDATIVVEQVPRNLAVARRIERMRVLVARYDQEVATANFADRRSAGLNAFLGRGAGRDRVEKGFGIIDTLRTEHARMLREVRENLTSLEEEIETAAADAEWETFLIRTAAVAIFILALSLMLRLLQSSLRAVVRAGEALEAGRYEAARLPYHHRAPNAEMARLALAFDRLAQSIAIRERQLQEDIEQLKELERLKADFVSTVSHELRTPLTSMRGALGLLLGGAGGDLSPKGRELLRIALTNTDRLIRLINDILDIEKIDAGHVQIRRDRLRLKPILETTVTGLEAFARENGCTLALTDVEDLEIIGDADRLIQVFTNLVSNAVKFTERGTSVDVSARTEGDVVRVCVRDRGPGIAPEFASRIFGRFQQADGAVARRAGGTGLGLSIAKAITELHGGRISFENASDGGAVFSVHLPVAPAPVGIEDQRPCVLIVEDDDSMREVLAALLEPHAHAVPVPDAVAAMKALARHRVRVVVIDHGLPGVDGLDFAKRLRADPRYRSLPILLYSAGEFPADKLREAGIRVGDAFVKTRDTEQSLLERVRRELQSL